MWSVAFQDGSLSRVVAYCVVGALVLLVVFALLACAVLLVVGLFRQVAHMKRGFVYEMLHRFHTPQLMGDQRVLQSWVDAKGMTSGADEMPTTVHQALVEFLAILGEASMVWKGLRSERHRRLLMHGMQPELVLWSQLQPLVVRSEQCAAFLPQLQVVARGGLLSEEHSVELRTLCGVEV